MKQGRERVGDVLALARRAVEVNFDGTYEEIGIRSFGRGIFHKEPVSGAQLGAKRVFKIEPGDLLLSNVFAWEGAIALASEAERGKIGSHRFMTYVPIDGRIDTAWASWYFRSEKGLELIRQASPGSAGRNRTLAIDRFEALEIPLPRIDEQRRVASRLDRLEAAAGDLTRLSERASALRAAVTVSAAWRSDLNAEAKRRDGWKSYRLDEVLALDIRAVAIEPDSSYDIAGVYSFGRGLFRRASIVGSQTSYKSMHRLRAGQVVMSRLKAWEGALAVVPSDLEGSYLSPEFPTFEVCRDLAEPDYIGLVLTSEPFWSGLRGASQGIGARRERVSAAKLLACQVFLPPMWSQRSTLRTAAALTQVGAYQTNASTRVKAMLPATINAAFAGLA